MYEILWGVLIVFILICLVVLFSIIVVKIYISKIKKYNYMLAQKRIEQEKAITQTIIETQSGTLDLLSKELHDDAGQQLTYINFQLEKLKLTNPELIENIAPIGNSLNNLSKSIRNLSHSIDSKKFSNYKLLDLIQSELDKVNDLNVVDCTLKVEDGFFGKFTINEDIILFRIFQEILNNMLKHAQAKRFIVEIRNNPLVFQFSDNGIGFSLEKNEIQTSGLRNIKNRAELIGFSVEINSSLTIGTRIELYRKK